MIHQEHETYCQIFWGNVHWNEYTSAKEIKQVFHYFLRLTAFEIFLFFENTNNILHVIQTCYIL